MISEYLILMSKQFVNFFKEFEETKGITVAIMFSPLHTLKSDAPAKTMLLFAKVREKNRICQFHGIFSH